MTGVISDTLIVHVTYLLTYLLLTLVAFHYLSPYHNCDSTTIRRYHDAFDYDGSDRNYYMRSIRLRYDYDPTTTYRARLLPLDAIQREQKNEHVSFSS